MQNNTKDSKYLQRKSLCLSRKWWLRKVKRRNPILSTNKTYIRKCSRLNSLRNKFNVCNTSKIIAGDIEAISKDSKRKKALGRRK